MVAPLGLPDQPFLDPRVHAKAASIPGTQRPGECECASGVRGVLGPMSSGPPRRSLQDRLGAFTVAAEAWLESPVLWRCWVLRPGLGWTRRLAPSRRWDTRDPSRAADQAVRGTPGG